jgi:hypothetical protein
VLDIDVDRVMSIPTASRFDTRNDTSWGHRQERTAQRVLAEIVGPSLRWATARITKTTDRSVTPREGA